MIEIPRGRNWTLVHTITDDGETPSDLTHITSVRCQLRAVNDVKNPKTGIFERPLVAEITAALSGTLSNILTLSLAGTELALVQPGTYHMDAVADNGDVLLPVEAVAVVNVPTQYIPTPP